MRQSTPHEIYLSVCDCVADLAANGIDVLTLDAAGIRALIREHRHYFDAMIGWQVGDRALALLLCRAVKAEHPVAAESPERAERFAHPTPSGSAAAPSAVQASFRAFDAGGIAVRPAHPPTPAAEAPRPLPPASHWPWASIGRPAQ